MMSQQRDSYFSSKLKEYPIKQAPGGRGCDDNMDTFGHVVFFKADTERWLIISKFILISIRNNKILKILKQAGAELCQAQVKRGLAKLDLPTSLC